MNIHSLMTQGIETQAIEIQVHFRFQIPSFQILGLAGPEIQEAKERIIAAFTSSELEFPRKKVIVNLAPADLKKRGTGHDLAMALGVISKLMKYDLFKQDSKIFAWGELGLDGRIVSCGRSASILNLMLNTDGNKILYLSPEDARDVEELLNWRAKKNLQNPDSLELRVVRSLHEVVHPTRSSSRLIPRKTTDEIPELLPLLPHQERILDLSIIGRHHTLILGPKGVGKSQLLEWFRWLTPESDASQTWLRLLYEDTAKRKDPLPHVFPLRSVHSQVKPSHLLGSWDSRGFRAGELSLAHGGILVADEFLEWHRDAKECLREPLQNKKTTLTRVQGTTKIECDFQLVATGNLCPCGGLPKPFQNSKTTLSCRCSLKKVEEYLARLSGPIADRIDLVGILDQVEDPHRSALSGSVILSTLDQKKAFLHRRRRFAIEHFGSIPSELSVSWLEANFPKDEEMNHLLKERTVSLRSRHKAMRLGRTIQAWHLNEIFEKEHLLEALTYRDYSTGVPQ